MRIMRLLHMLTIVNRQFAATDSERAAVIVNSMGAAGGPPDQRARRVRSDEGTPDRADLADLARVWPRR